MARQESKAKGGFYPTPDDEMNLVCQKFSIDLATRAFLIDPCAGNGSALKMLSDHLKRKGGLPETYGIELEETRAQEAKEVLDHAVKCDYNQARTSTKAFSVLWLNPPYDHHDGDRVEVTFLRDLTDPVSGKLMVGGVLGYCIPQKVLKDAAPILAARFDHLSVFRFTDKSYPTFKQVVVFGIRRGTVNRGKEAKKVRTWLKFLGEQGPDAVKSLDTPTAPYNVPPAPDKKIIFKGSLTDIKEIADSLEDSPVWDEINYLLLPYKKAAIMQPPVLPLKPTHDAIAISAGVIGGNMGSHLLTGRSKKVSDKEFIPPDEKGKGEKIIEKERYITTVRVFSPTGVYDLE